MCFKMGKKTGKEAKGDKKKRKKEKVQPVHSTIAPTLFIKIDHDGDFF